MTPLNFYFIERLERFDKLEPALKLLKTYDGDVKAHATLKRSEISDSWIVIVRRYR